MTKIKLLLPLLMASLLLMLAVSPAEAGAEGYTTWGPRVIAGHSIPTGYMYHDTNGSGLNVNSEYAGWGGYLCNWWVDFDFYSSSNARYYHAQGREHASCNVTGAVPWNAPGGTLHARTGYVCATIYMNAVYVVRACNNIHP